MKNIDSSAFIHPTADIADDAIIGPYCYIGKGVIIAKKVKLMGHNTVQDYAVIDTNTTLYPFSMVSHYCIIEANAILHAHCTIGSPGFGYATDKEGKHHYIAQIGKAIIKKSSQIGCFTCIDRAALDKTEVAEDCHIGAYSHLAHNVSIKKGARVYHSLVVAGSTKIGENLTTEGFATINGHIEMGDNIICQANSVFHNSEVDAGNYQGFPHQKIEDYKEKQEVLKNLNQLIKKLEAKNEN